MALNFSIYAIIGWWLMGVAPKIYNEMILYRANNWTYNNIRPWSPEYTEKVKAVVPAETWAMYKRSEALQHNSFQNLPLFASAVILGTVSDYDYDHESLNLWILAILTLRGIYSVIYMKAMTQLVAWLRTGIWAVYVGIMLFLVLRSGQYLEDKSVISI